MTLYFVDSLGQRSVVAQHIGSPEEALPLILNHKKNRFAPGSGTIKLHCVAGNRITFSRDGKDSGFVLERELGI